MNTEQMPTPQKQIAHALSGLDKLSMMRKQPDFDQATAAEMEAGLVDTIDRILTNNPDIRNKANPVMARALVIQSLSKKAHEKKLAERFPPKLVQGEPSIYTELPHHMRGELDQLYVDLTNENIDQMYLDLLDSEMLKKKSVVVSDPEEASHQLGVEQSELEKAYGLLAAIDDQPAHDDIIEFVAIHFERPESQGGEPIPDGDGPSSTQGRYLGRVRKSAQEDIISIVLDAVPYIEDNAVYVLRNDDGAISSVEESFSSKKQARANGARRVFHRQETGTAGVLKRINKLLLMSFESFRRTE